MDTEKNPQDLTQIKKKLLSEASFETLSEFYSLFADPTRLTIICLLLHNELCVNDIAEVLGVSQSVVSHQLAILRKQDIVTFHRKGKSVLYSLKDNHIKDLFNTGLEHTSEKDEGIYQDRKKKGY
ncbi:MAG: metalloregulator ArsR/SmtB family transcription factor [Bacilli bacterium]|jgi:DNA-binding transcriptional ArsR family regulator|nr:metalloregulator ArsR/SmtB family transcription factor [Bacilli bacterium]